MFIVNLLIAQINSFPIRSSYSKKSKLTKFFEHPFLFLMSIKKIIDKIPTNIEKITVACVLTESFMQRTC